MATYTLVPNDSDPDSPTSSTASIHTVTTERGFSMSSLSRSLQRFGFALLPSFVQTYLHPRSARPRKLYPTSYLDGLRGVASLIVFVCHYTEANVPWYISSYGLNDDGVESSPLQLPFLRILYSGRPMVHIFFVISGYALSYKPLRLLRQRSWEDLHTTLTSSVFRRAFRLFVPTTLSTFTIMLFVYYGVIGERRETFNEQFWDWTTAVWVIGNAWFWDTMQRPAYDVHLWTIPIEMSHSMLLFLCILGLSRSRTPVRLGMLLVIMWYSIRMGRWAAVEFLYGMFIAEIGLIQDERAAAIKSKEHNEGSSPILPTKDGFSRTTSVDIWSTFKTVFWLSNFLCGIWIGGWPNWGVEETPGFAYLVSITPYPFWQDDDQYLSYFWYAIAAAQIVTACQQLHCLRRAFTTPLAQYLGNLSYALYLVHGLIEDILKVKLIPVLADTIGTDTMVRRFMFWLIGLLLFLIPVVWAADLFWRYVDRGVVDMAKWLEVKCSIREEDEKVAIR